jgi:GT2 family glycosyltransferase
MAQSSAARVPLVSVVIVSARDAERLRRCLEAVVRHAGEIEIEIVVVLNAAEPGLSAALEQVDAPLHVVVSDVPLGFAGGVNLGARCARGELLQILHDDAEVQEAWLQALVAALDRRPRAGAAGSLVVGHDGVAQSGGHIIWSDGRTAPPWLGAPRVEEPADVEIHDFCSSASLLVRRRAWDAAGGFDEDFHPAQFVDADFGMALRQAGYVVVCATRSVVRHERGGSASVPMKLFATARNHDRFARKWHAELMHQSPFGDDAAALERARDATRRRARTILASPAPAPAAPARPDGGAETADERVARERRALLRDIAFKGDYIADLERRAARADDTIREAREGAAATGRELAVARGRLATLDAIEAGGWWRLRTRLLPVLRPLSAVRRSARARGARGRRSRAR